METAFAILWGWKGRAESSETTSLFEKDPVALVSFDWNKLEYGLLKISLGPGDLPRPLNFWVSLPS